MALKDYYTSTITRKVLSKTDSAYSKNKVESFSGVTTFSARIWKLNAREVVLDESQKPLVTHNAACGSDVTVLYTDRWTDGTNTYDITSVNMIQDSTSDHHYEVELRLV